jgi:hypothetical protein
MKGKMQEHAHFYSPDGLTGLYINTCPVPFGKKF